MFSNKKNIQNIENELHDHDLTANINSSFVHKPFKTEDLSEGDADSIYEFTFDPNEEPPPSSKQAAPRKKAKPKPKVIFVNNNYETNVLKTLQTLKKSIKRSSLDADDKENLFNKSPEPVEKHRDVQSVSPDQKNSPNGSKRNLIKESPSSRDRLLKDISFDNTPKVTTPKHPKASPWRAEIEEITSVLKDTNNLKEISKVGTKSKIPLSLQYTNSIGGENAEPKLKQPRLLDFIMKSSEKGTKVLEDARDRSSRLNIAEIVSKGPKNNDDNNENQEKEGSVQLFEELEVFPSVKPCRRSYGKKENVSSSNADRAHASASNLMNFSDELSAISTCNKKAELKQAKNQEQKPQLTKQEEEEVNAWAEAFNSMCEDVDDFPLIVE